MGSVYSIAPVGLLDLIDRRVGAPIYVMGGDCIITDNVIHSGHYGPPPSRDCRGCGASVRTHRGTCAYCGGQP